MKLRQVVKGLEAIAPLRYAEPGDNVGLLAGDLLMKPGADLSPLTALTVE